MLCWLRKRWIGFLVFLRGLHPAKLVLLGYAAYILVGWLLLNLPFMQARPGLGALDNLFTATSAVSTTGLVTVATGESYSLPGQIVVLLLIQLGGIGYMTFGSFVVLAGRRELSATREGIAKTVFALPSSFHLGQFLRGVVVFTAVIEAAGAAALYAIFRDAGRPDAVWSAVFHSVSSFCTAGFSLYGNSFEGWTGHFWLNAVIAALSYLGAIGFIVCVDFWNRLTGRARAITLTSKIILWVTFWMGAVATLLLFLTEPSLHNLPPDERLTAAFFQAMTASTTVGFNTIPIGSVSGASAWLLVVLMVVGSSPSGTGGGMKCTTLSALFGVVRSVIRGQQEVRFWSRNIPAVRVWSAAGGAFLYVCLLMGGTYLLLLTESAPLEALFFEAASALGTVGLSMGATATLTPLGKLIVITLMFCGRLGALTLGMALFGAAGRRDEVSDHDLAV